MCISFTGENLRSIWFNAKVVATVNHVGVSFNLFTATIGDVWIIPSFRIRSYVLHVERTFHVSSRIVTNISESFSSPNGSFGLAGWKHYQKITIPIFRLVLKKSLFKVAFLVFFSIAIFSPYFLLVSLLLQYVALYHSRAKLSISA